MARIMVVVGFRDDLVRLNNQVLRETKYAEQSPDTVHLAITYSKYTLILTKLFAASFFLGGLFPVFVSMYLYFFMKIRVLPFGFVIPGISDSTSPGFEINFFHHLLQVLLTCPGIVCCMSMAITYIMNVCLQIDVIEVKLQKLCKVMQQREKNSTNVQDVDLTEIIQLHQQVYG